MLNPYAFLGAIEGTKQQMLEAMRGEHTAMDYDKRITALRLDALERGSPLTLEEIVNEAGVVEVRCVPNLKHDSSYASYYDYSRCYEDAKAALSYVQQLLALVGKRAGTSRVTKETSERG
jgi:hypothetical protein